MMNRRLSTVAFAVLGCSLLPAVVEAQDPPPTFSVAVVTTGAVTVAPDGTVSVAPGEAYNAKVGQRIGNTTIREIQRDRVVVDVEEFGLTDRRTMFIASRRQGGTQ